MLSMRGEGTETVVYDTVRENCPLTPGSFVVASTV
jgi:hypothetical protein